MTISIDLITNIIKETLTVYCGEVKITSPWREPLAAVADAADPAFADLKMQVSPTHFLPENLLPDARSVICFFLPFTKKVTESNRKERLASTEWARAYIDSNRAIAAVSTAISEKLERGGHKTAAVSATHNFLPEKLISDWSHRHAAVIAGLGTPGINNMLITKSGCSGRVGSVITSCIIEAASRPDSEHCLYKANGSCGYCVKQCPTGALTFSSFDRFRCYGQLLENNRFHNMEAEVDVCGKCITGLPCSLRAPAVDG